MRPIFSELQVPSAAGDPLPEPLARFRSMARGSRWPTGALTARVHRGSKTPTRPATARRFSRAFGRPRALLRFLQMSVSTSTTTDHSNIPNHRIRGWDDCRPGESCLFLGGRPPEVRRARGREKPISTLSTMIAHGGDFAPTPIAPGTSCRAHRSSPCPERRGGESGFAAATTACTAAATRGSCDARLPRRSPTFTNPRGLPLKGRR
jgi:hypothetical protein